MLPKDFSQHFQDWTYLHPLQNMTYRHLSCHSIRRESWDKSIQEATTAENANLPITRMEMDMGMRKEYLEWEVREAVLRLQEKGFTTYYSGYEGLDGEQVLYFVSIDPPPEEMLKNIWQLTDETGILTWTSSSHLRIEKDSLCIDYNNGNPLYIWGINFIDTRGDPNLIKQHWDLIADRIDRYPLFRAKCAYLL